MTTCLFFLQPSKNMAFCIECSEPGTSKRRLLRCPGCARSAHACCLAENAEQRLFAHGDHFNGDDLLLAAHCEREGRRVRFELQPNGDWMCSHCAAAASGAAAPSQAAATGCKLEAGQAARMAFSCGEEEATSGAMPQEARVLGDIARLCAAMPPGHYLSVVGSFASTLARLHTKCHALQARARPRPGPGPGPPRRTAHLPFTTKSARRECCLRSPACACVASRLPRGCCRCRRRRCSTCRRTASSPPWWSGCSSCCIHTRAARSMQTSPRPTPQSAAQGQP